MSAIVSTEPSNPALLRLWLSEFDRRIDRLVESCEVGLVEAAVRALDTGASPQEIVTRVQLTSRHPLAGAVGVNAVAAASHQVVLGANARQEIQTLVVVCPLALAGVGWLSRLGRQTTPSGAVVGVAIAAQEALMSDSWWRSIVLRSRHGSPARLGPSQGSNRVA